MPTLRLSHAPRLLLAATAGLLVSALAGPASAGPRLPGRADLKVPQLLRRVVGLRGLLSTPRDAWPAHFKREAAIRAIETEIHERPDLENTFRDYYGHLGGKTLWRTRDALVMLGIGTVVNIGGFLQPHLLIPYLLAGVALDVFNFASRAYEVARMKRRTTVALLRDGRIPEELLAPHRDAVGAVEELGPGLPPAPPRGRARARLHENRLPGAVQKVFSLISTVAAHPTKWKSRWTREVALQALEAEVHKVPHLEWAFEQRYGELGGRSLWSLRDAVVMAGIGEAINIGGFLQPNLLVPYLVAGVAADLGTFGLRLASVARTRRQTLLSLIADGTVPDALLAPFNAALGRAPTDRNHAPRRARVAPSL
ncbi:MAG: hypothetical protein IT371_16715 [Deltaproteobacteria bacterium]|nr:hypothetical protein [Deltaproteobacteria bacterium]